MRPSARWQAGAPRGRAPIGSQRCPHLETAAGFHVVQRHHQPCVRSQREETGGHCTVQLTNARSKHGSGQASSSCYGRKPVCVADPRARVSMGACHWPCGLPCGNGSERPLLSPAASPQRNAVVGHVVQEGPAVDALVQREAHRVQHLPRRMHLRPHLPTAAQQSVLLVPEQRRPSQDRRTALTLLVPEQ